MFISLTDFIFFLHLQLPIQWNQVTSHDDYPHASAITSTSVYRRIPLISAT